MPLVIWKYSLALVAKQLVEVPKGAKPLTVQLQDGTPCLWAVVNPSNSIAYWKIVIHGTGAASKDITHQTYLGTVQDDGYVWHFFLEI